MPKGSLPGQRRGGRQKGTPNRATAAKAAAIAASGLTPLDYLLSVMRDETAPRAERMEAAAKAAPYVHARLAAIEYTSPIPVEPPIDVSELDPRTAGGAARGARAAIALKAPASSCSWKQPAPNTCSITITDRGRPPPRHPFFKGGR